MLQNKIGDAGSIGAVSSESVSNESADISEQQIAVRAYERWVGRGAPASDGVEDWLAARCELEAELSTPTTTAARRKPAAKPKAQRARKSVH